MDTILKQRKNKHLSSSECYKLEILSKSKMSVSEISELLERDKSTIYREIKRGTVSFRNSDWSVRKEYSAYYSLNIREQLMSKTGRKLFYEQDGLLLSYLQSKLDEKYSPDAISGELRHQGISTISTQTIYNYISLGLLESIEYRKYSKQSKSKARIAYNNRRGRSIEERLFKLKDRAFGNWEMDTAVGKQGSNENNNKLIDEFIKKKTDIKNFSNSYIKKIQDWMNNYPRKLFNYKSANDIFYENLKQCLNSCKRF